MSTRISIESILALAPPFSLGIEVDNLEGMTFDAIAIGSLLTVSTLRIKPYIDLPVVTVKPLLDVSLARFSLSEISNG